MVALCARAAAGSEYRDPTGYSFTYPEGWFIASSRREVTGGKPLPQEIQTWLDKNRADLNKVSVFLIRHGPEDFHENLHVAVLPFQAPINDRALKDLLKTLPEKFSSIGAKLENLEGRVQTTGNNESLVVEYQITLAGAASPMHQRQLYIPGGGKTYVVTCSGKADTFATYAPTFDTILASFKTPPPISKQVDSAAYRAGYIVGVVVGVLMVVVCFLGVAGIGLYFLIKSLTGAKHRQPRGDEPFRPN
jgi:hypothetical protein